MKREDEDTRYLFSATVLIRRLFFTCIITRCSLSNGCVVCLIYQMLLLHAPTAARRSHRGAGGSSPAIFFFRARVQGRFDK